MNEKVSKIQRYKEYLLLANFSVQTVSMYIGEVSNYYSYLEEHLVNVQESEESIRQYLLYRLKQGFSRSTINCDYSSLKKYYEVILDKAWNIKKYQGREGIKYYLGYYLRKM